MVRKISPDSLGAAAESDFQSLCARAELTCNKSDRDRTGWDFYVDFPMPEAGDALPLDKRLTTSCLVQLKATTVNASDRVKLSPSTAERLAKDIRPAVIVVLKASADGRHVAGYVIHLMDDVLARVLKRQRQAHARSRCSVNHQEISFDYRKSGKRFELSPEGLRDVLARICGDEPSRYTDEKRRQLEDLGYENSPFEAEALIWIENAEHLSNIALGLESVIPKAVRAFDTRFGIRIPYRGPLLDQMAELRFELFQVGQCVVSVRGPVLAPAAIFIAEILAVPPVKGIAVPWLLVRHSDFVLKFGSNSVTFETIDALGEKSRSLEEWVQLTRGLAYLAGGGAVVNVKTEDGPTFLPMPMADTLVGPRLDELPHLTSLLEGWQRLLEMAGLSPTQTTSIDAIRKAVDAQIAVDLILGNPPKASFAFYSEDFGNPSDIAHALFANTCSIMGMPVTYSVKVTLEQQATTPPEHRSIKFHPLDIRPGVPSLRNYAEEQATATGISILIESTKLTFLASSRNKTEGGS